MFRALIDRFMTMLVVAVLELIIVFFRVFVFG